MARSRGLLIGEARFTGDLDVAGRLHLVFVRSPLASARITSISISAASRVEGVAAIFTAADLPMLPVWEIALIPEDFGQPPLAVDVVRYVGERVVAVIAESLAAAIDAAELVVVGYDALSPVTDVVEAARPGARVLFPRRADNVCLAWDGDAPDARFEPTTVGVSVEHRIPRLSVAPLEGHAALAVPEPDGRLTVWASTQVPSATRVQLARSLEMAITDVRVVTPAVGGGFGGKAAGGVCDHMVVAAAARKLGRPVLFVEDRGTNLVGMQGRGVRNSVELRATPTGELVAIRADILCDAGAYPSVGAVEPGKTRLMACGPYRIGVADIRARAVVTNLPPVGAYRGPGRSEASVMLERTLDVLAADLGIDPLAIRLRNVLHAEDMPYRSPTGIEYDCGDYPALLQRLAEVSDYHQLRRRQAAGRDRGERPIGIGLSMIIDSTAWFSRSEGAAVRVGEDGTVLVLAGSASAGQHHDVSYREVVRSVLPVPAEQIRVVEGDTDAWSRSDGTMGSRTAQLAGTAILQSAQLVVDLLRRVAADALEASPDDIVFHDGAGFGVRGSPSSARSLAQLVGAAAEPVEASCVFEQAAATYPSAAHLSLVEVDTETGRVVPLRHIAVTDSGRLLDPPSARAQVVGATVQGIGQALYEEATFDADGNPLTVSFADYAIPSAAEVPMIETHFLETRSPRNPLGAKGVGEIGMIAAPVAVQNAVVDALRHLGVRHLDMPCTPQRVWAAIRGRP